MSLGETARMLTRWWWITALGTLLATAAGAALFLVTPPTYTRTSSYLLLSPVQTVDGPSNPFLNLANGVAMTASILAARVSDPETVQTVTGGDDAIEYSVVLNTALSAPVLEVTVSNTDTGVVDTVLAQVGDLLATDLAQLQRDSGAPQVSWVTVRQLTAQPEATVGRSAPLRNSIAGVVAVLLLTLVVVALVERRRRSRAVRAHTGDGTPTPTGATSTDAQDPVEPAVTRTPATTTNQGVPLDDREDDDREHDQVPRAVVSGTGSAASTR